MQYPIFPPSCFFEQILIGLILGNYLVRVGLLSNSLFGSKVARLYSTMNEESNLLLIKLGKHLRNPSNYSGWTTSP